MAPLAPNSTLRVFVDYVANGFQHRMLFRGAGEFTPEAGHMDAIDAFLVALGPLMPTDYEIVGYSVSARNSDLTFPFLRTAPAVLGVNPGGGGEHATFATFVGRGSNGRHTRIHVLGTGIQPQDFAYAYNYRITEGEAPYLTPALDALTGAYPVAIGNAVAFWYRYVNIGYNAYWQRRVR